MNNDIYEELLKTCSQHMGYISKITRKNLNMEFAIVKDEGSSHRIDSEIETWHNRVEEADQIKSGIRILTQWKTEDYIHPFYALFFVRARHDDLDAICSIYDAGKSTEVNQYIGFPFCDDVVLYGGKAGMINSGFGLFMFNFKELPEDNYLRLALKEKKIFYAPDIEDRKKAKGRITEAMDRRAAIRSALYVPITFGTDSVAVLVVYSPLSCIWGQFFGVVTDNKIKPADITFYNFNKKEEVSRTIRVQDAIESCINYKSGKLLEMASYFSKSLGRVIFDNREIRKEIDEFSHLRQIIDNLDEICNLSEKFGVGPLVNTELVKIKSYLSPEHIVGSKDQSLDLSRAIKHDMESLVRDPRLFNTRLRALNDVLGHAK